MSLKVVQTSRCFGGSITKYEHESRCTGTTMRVNVFLPGGDGVYPSLYYLSGLTCTEDNCMQKSGAQRAAARHGIAFICPDTSPRGANAPGEDESYDLGTGAGFYLDATQEPWSKSYRMYSYITDELPAILESNLPLIPGRRSITGHSMGGHGALILALKNPGMFQSVSAFAPICHPSVSAWGIKAFSAYLGQQKHDWAAYDATELVLSGKTFPGQVLIDQGTKDEFLDRLGLDDFKQAAKEKSVKLDVRLQDGYDHSYYFVATFIDDHVKFHSEALHQCQ